MRINKQAGALAMVVFTVLIAAPAVAGNRECGPGVAVLTGPISDNVIVPPGSVCNIDHAQIDGYVTVEPTGRVRLTNSTVSGNFKLGAGTDLQVTDAADPFTPSVIGGNLRADGAISISHDGVPLIIQGNVSVDNLTGEVVLGPATIEGNFEVRDGGVLVLIFSSTVGGNVKASGNTGTVEILDNTIAGNVRAVSNTGSVVVTGNTIGGNLVCRDNVPPAVAAGNVVAGKSECP